MADNLTKEQRHLNMSRIRSRDTKIEIILRSVLWTRGYRYRKNYKKLPGTPDIVLTKYRIAVFCDSEFFHGNDWDELKKRLEKGINPDFWIKKISMNWDRDAETDARLRSDGWTALRFWGRDITSRTDECVASIEKAVFDRITCGE